jgi:hypothetical protein
MVRTWMIVLGFALALLWLLGLAADRQVTLLWFDAVAALLSFAAAGLIDEHDLGARRAGAPAVLGFGLAAVWIAGLAMRAPPWAVWANFALACGYFGLAIAAAASSERRLSGHARWR